jgi:hypothetical protein
MQERAEAFWQLGQQLQEMLAVAVIAKDRPPFIASGGEMIPSIRYFDTEWPRHDEQENLNSCLKCQMLRSDPDDLTTQTPKVKDEQAGPDEGR